MKLKCDVWEAVKTNKEVCWRKILKITIMLYIEPLWWYTGCYILYSNTKLKFWFLFSMYLSIWVIFLSLSVLILYTYVLIYLLSVPFSLKKFSCNFSLYQYLSSFFPLFLSFFFLVCLNSIYLCSYLSSFCPFQL